MAAVENIEWLNQNLLRAYPVREDSDVTPLLPDGTQAKGLTLPNCLITDFAFTIPFDDMSGTVPCLTGLTLAGDGVSLEISLGETVLTATEGVQLSTHTINRTYLLKGRGDYADCGGWITLGDLKRAAEMIPEGTYRFATGQVPFEVSTLRMALRGVRSLSAVGKYGLVTSAKLYGHVRLIAGSDMNVRADPSANEIWLEADSGTGYERTEPCTCASGGSSAGLRLVKTINGMSVENVTIVGAKPCLEVETTTTPPTVTIKDACSTPCCGCSELNFVESAVMTINRSIATLQGYADALRTRLEELNTNLLTTKASLDAYPS